jgi:Core-2/I-Branching enzyme
VKIAVICLAYLGPARAVELLAGYFAAADADIWLHVDSATDASEYQALAARTPKIRLVTPRLRCWWGGFNGARAVLNAAASARAVNQYDRYLYLTEDTVPLRSISELLNRLASDREYIVLGDETSVPERWVQARYDGFYCWDCDAMCPRCTNHEDWVVTPELERQIARLAQLRTRGKVKLAKLHHGPAYWGLSASAMDQLLERDRTDDHLRESFEFSSIPEEQYYHTILGEAGYATRAAPFLYMDFSMEPKPFIYRSRAELLALQDEPHLFARKIDFKAPEVADFIQELARG